jgi:hypothetical protein
VQLQGVSFCILFFNSAKIVSAGKRSSQQQQPKDYGINTRANAQGFHLFRFLLVCCTAFTYDLLTKNLYYAKATSYYHSFSYGTLPTYLLPFSSSCFTTFGV